MTKEEQIFKEGDVVPYINTATKICWTKVKSFRDVEHGRNRIWFYGNDIKTGAETYYPVNYSKNYLEAMEQYANQRALEVAGDAWDASQKWSAAPHKERRERILRGQEKPPSEYLEILDKQTFLSNLKKKLEA